MPQHPGSSHNPRGQLLSSARIGSLMAGIRKSAKQSRTNFKKKKVAKNEKGSTSKA